MRSQYTSCLYQPVAATGTGPEEGLLAWKMPSWVLGLRAVDRANVGEFKGTVLGQSAQPHHSIRAMIIAVLATGHFPTGCPQVQMASCRVLIVPGAAW